MVLSIIVPVYNEKKTILEILRRIVNVNLYDFGIAKEIIVVDDGSDDGTKEILLPLKKKYKIIFHDNNKGKGMAIRTAIKEATGDYIIIQDADLEYDPEDYRKLIECAFFNRAEVVYGSRILSENNKFSHLSFYLGGVVLNLITNILYGSKITDMTACYKLFRAKTLKSFSLTSRRFEFCPEATAKAAKRKIKIYEVPIAYNPRHRNEGKKIRWRDGVTALWTLIRYKFKD